MRIDKLPSKATFTLPVMILASSAVEGLPPLEETATSVGVHVRVAALGERNLKGLMLIPEQLKDGWKSMANAFVNWGHDPGKLYGTVRAVAQQDGGIYASLALSRAKLQAESMDPSRLTKDLSVSAEWVWNVEDSYVMQGDKKLTLDEANEAGLLAMNSTPSGQVEITAADASATIYPGGTSFGDLALVPLAQAKPAFPSARMLAATAAAQTLLYSDSLDALIAKVSDAIRIAYTKRAPDGEVIRPWIMATFSDSVVFTTEYYDSLSGYVSQNWIVPYAISDDGTLTLGEAKTCEVDKQFVAAAQAAIQSSSPNDGMIHLGIADVPAISALLESELPFVNLIYGEGKTPAKKSGGHNSPPKGYPASGDDYADGVNFMYPIDTGELTQTASIQFVGAVKGRKGLTYSRDELVSMAKKIVARAKKFKVTVSPTSVVGKYAGMTQTSKEVNAVSGIKETYARAEVEALLARAKEEAHADAIAEMEQPDSEVKKAAITEYEANVLPIKLSEARAEEKTKLEARSTAVDELHKVKPLSDEEKKVVLASIDSGEFDLKLALLERRNAVLEEKLAGKSSDDGSDERLQAASTALAAGAGAGGEVETDTGNSEVDLDKVNLLAGR